ncbi:hypothetical protein A0H81_12217 [Grifola frondosa]|uniref:Uncharacterized protein n=1 Tax=Grifola frondosa TaxID=5627 RepID=A0A1C7LTP0_GRIFR|nr:hypothetical protein A0H81_12217 [Grifola frondosa]
MPKSSADPVIVANIVGAILIGVEFQALSYGVVSINLFMVVNVSFPYGVSSLLKCSCIVYGDNTNRIGFAVITGMIFTGILSLTVLTGSAAVSARLFIASHQRQRIKRIKLLLEIIFSTGVSADILLTALLCVFLNGSRSGLKRYANANIRDPVTTRFSNQYLYHRTDSAINILILYAIETGLFPGIIEGAGMVAVSQPFLTIQNRPDERFAVLFKAPQFHICRVLRADRQPLNARALVRRFIESPITVNFTVLNDDPPHSASSASPTRIGTSACSGTSTMQLHADEETLHTRLAGDIKKAGMPELEVVEKELLGGTGFPGIIPVLDLEGGSAPGYARDVIVDAYEQSPEV